MVVFDKIGMFMFGLYCVVKIIVVDGFIDDEVFCVVVLVQCDVEYLIVQVLMISVKEYGIDVLMLQDFEFMLGCGVCVVVEECLFYVGGLGLLRMFVVELLEMFWWVVELVVVDG